MSNFIKGMFIGGMISAGFIMMYENDDFFNKKKLMKKGKKILKKMV